MVVGAKVLVHFLHDAVGISPQEGGLGGSEIVIPGAGFIRIRKILEPLIGKGSLQAWVG